MHEKHIPNPIHRTTKNDRYITRKNAASVYRIQSVSDYLALPLKHEGKNIS